MKVKAYVAGVLACAMLAVASVSLPAGTVQAVPPEYLLNPQDVFERLLPTFEKATEAAAQYYGEDAGDTAAQAPQDASDAASDAPAAVVLEEGVLEDGVIVGIAVTGEVDNPFIANVVEYARIAPMMRFRNTACFRHPVAANAQLDADVTGFSLVRLIQDAEPAEGVDTVTFITASGERLSVPLLSVVHPFSAIVLTAGIVSGFEDTAEGTPGVATEGAEAAGDSAEIATEGASAAVSHSNELWLDSPSGRADLIDVVAIELTVG